MSVTVKEKREFLAHFLNNYAFSIRMNRWILAYLLDDAKTLKRVHFVEDASEYPNAIMLATKCSRHSIYYAGRLNDEPVDAEKMFHFIKQTDSDIEIYIQLVFSNTKDNPYYWTVLESATSEKDTPLVSNKDKKVIKTYIDAILKQNRERLLEVLIDEALKEGRKDRFMQLIKIREELKNAK